MDMSPENKKEFLKNVDLLKTDFEVKIADFGLAKQLKSMKNKLKTVCGSKLFMSP